MNPRCVLTFLVASALCAAPAHVHAETDPALTALFGSESEARGEFDAWFVELLDAVAADPGSPYASACLSKVRSLHGSATHPEEIEKRLDPVLTRGVRDAELDEMLRDLLNDRAEARGEFEKAKTYGGERGYLRRFGVIGPFGSRNNALLHRSYAPEASDVDFTKPLKGSTRMVRWLELPRLGNSAWVDPAEQIRQGATGVVYAVATLRASRARTVLFKTWCSDSFKIFVNGREVITADRSRERTPDVVYGTAHLEEGWNRILVKVVGNASFGLKAADPETGFPLEDIEEGEPFATDVFSGRPGRAETRTYRTPWEKARDLAAGDDAPAAELAAAASLTDWEGRSWEALRLFERAVAALPASGQSVEAANIRAACGRYLASFVEHPRVHRKLQARHQFETALVHFPGHNSATQRLARYEDEDDRPDRAVNLLKKYVEETPTTSAFMALAEICKGRGWEKEAIEAAQSALDLWPNSRAAAQFLSGYDSKYANREALLQRIQARIARDKSDWAAWSELVRVQRARGEDEKALETLRSLSTHNPGSLGYRRRIAGVLRNLGRLDESLAEWRGLESLVPEEDRYPREVGEILEIQRDTEGAKAAYRRSLALRPYQPNLWRGMSRLEDMQFDFAKGWEPDVDELIAALPCDEELKEKYPKAIAITLLDHSVVRVNEDGSAMTYVHMAYKLLDEKGVQKYGDVGKAGEMLEIRAILPDGSVMLPTGLSRSAFNMEGLEPGTVIDHRYITFQGPSSRGGFDGGKFYFQDFSRRNPNPVLLSRFVVLAPKDMKLEPIPLNFGDDPKVEDFEGLAATIWEKRDVPRITAERFMPPNDEILPLVDYSKPPDFDDANWEYLGSRPNTWPTPILEDVVSEVVRDDQSDREKLEALYTWVNTEITGDRGTSSYPSATVLEKAGSRARLFEALVRTAAVPYRTGRAMAWNGVGRDLSRPDVSAFTRGFLWLMPEGDDPIPFFMGARLAPFGLVPQAYRGSSAFLASEDGGQIIQLPENGPNVRFTTSFEIRLGADAASTSVKGELVYRNSANYRGKRQFIDMTDDNRKKAAEAQLTRYFANPTLTAFELPDLETPGKPLRFVVEGTMNTYLAQQAGVYVASLGLPPSGMTTRFVQRSDRTYDLVLNSVRSHALDEIVIHLGDAFEVGELPEDHLAVHDLGTYSLTWRHRNGRVVVRREMHLRPARYTPDEFPGFVAWCKDIDDAEQRKLELRKAE